MDIATNQFFELFPVGMKGNTAMKIKLQRWPYFFHVFLASQFQDPLEQNDGPGGYSGNGSDIFIHGGLGQFFNLSLPFIHQCNPQLWRSHPVAVKRSVLHQYSTQVSKMGFFVQVVDGMTSANHQTFSSKQIRFRIVHVVKGKHIFCRLEMPVFQALLAYRDEFAFV